jgi:hypothetical protein
MTIKRVDGSDLKMPFNPRNGEIDRARETKLVQDTKIMQKVNQVHREAFTQRFPGQVEHMMRLTAERLQAILTKKPSDLTNIDTWDGKPDEVSDLAKALYYLSLISTNYPVLDED